MRWLGEPLRELTPETRQRATHLHLDCLHRKLHYRRDFRVAQVMPPIQHKHLSAARRQLLDRAVDRASEVVCSERRIGSGGSQGGSDCQILARSTFPKSHINLLMADVVDRAISRSAEQVSAEGTGAFPDIPLLPDAEEEILHQVFRHLSRMHVTVDERREMILVCAVKFLERALVSSSNTRQPFALADVTGTRV